MANETIGKIKCPIVGDYAEVRRDKRGKLYYVGEAGMIKPNLPAGQKWMNESAHFFDANSRNVTKTPESQNDDNFVNEETAPPRNIIGSFFSWGDE